jgi:hypothetical protein
LFVGKAIGSVISLNLFGGINGIRKGNAISAGGIGRLQEASSEGRYVVSS